MSRPSKLNKEVLKRLTEALKMGASYELACDYAGITFRTFRNWMKRAQGLDENALETKKNEYFQFFQSIKKANAEMAIRMLKIIEEAAPENWQAAAWKLERRFPQDFGRNRESIDDEVENWTTRIEIKGLNYNAIK